MVKVNVDGYGTFQIPPHKVQELIGWLSGANAVKIQENNTVQEIKDEQYTGRVLLDGRNG